MKNELKAATMQRKLSAQNLERKLMPDRFVTERAAPVRKDPKPQRHKSKELVVVAATA